MNEDDVGSVMGACAHEAPDFRQRPLSRLGLNMIVPAFFDPPGLSARRVLSRGVGVNSKKVYSGTLTPRS